MQVLQELCIGCERCVERCRHEALKMRYRDDRGYAYATYPERCVGCGRCVRACSTQAIDLVAIAAA